MASVDSLVTPENLHFEQSLLQDPDNESLWLDYVELVNGDLERSQFVLDRAVSRLPGSALLWNAYFMLPWTSQHLNVQLSIYRKALVMMGSSPSIWMRYLKLLQAVDSTFFKRELDTALFRLDSQYHGPIWKLYLDYADRSGGSEGARIYYRFIACAGDLQDGPTMTIDEIALKIAELGDYGLARKVISTLWTTNRPLSRLFSLVISEFCDLLGNSSFDDDEYFEELVTDAAGLFPDMEPEFLVKLAQYYVTHGNREKAFHFFVRALRASKSTKEVTTAFDLFAKYLEESSADIPNHQLHLYEKLLDDRPLYVNDVKLKQEINLVDHWLERIDLLLAMHRKEEMLTTFVKAIRSINPLNTVYTSANLATIWIRYADVYGAQGDHDTANMIFSRAIKSQFRTTDELVDIHIAWAELLLERSDEDALNHITELLRAGDDEDNSENQLILSPKLWEFRIDLLKAISSDSRSLENPQVVLGDMISAKVITLKILLDYAEYLQSEQLWDRFFSALEMGLSAFVLGEARYEIWKVYLPKLRQLNGAKVDTMREDYERCIAQVPPFRSKDFSIQYAEFERQNGLVSKAVRILRQSIKALTRAYDEKNAYSRAELNQISDDKYDLYVKILDMIAHYLKVTEMCREEFVNAVEDQHLTTPNTLHLCLRFIKFETTNHELARARALFRYAGGLGNPQHHTMKTTWRAWEEFELEHGTEDTYKQMLKFKRDVAKEFAEIEEAKSSINPMAFTKGTVTVETTANPDAIDLDMDM